MNFSILKTLWRARAQNILPPMPKKKHAFWVFKAMWDSARAKNFFGIVIFMKKSRCSFFCLVINQKAKFLEQFEVWIFFFLKIQLFPKILKIWNFWKFSILFWIFHEKIQYSKASTTINLKDIRILKIPTVGYIEFLKEYHIEKMFGARALLGARR